MDTVQEIGCATPATHMLLHAAGDHLGDAHAGTASSHHTDALVFQRMQRLALHRQRPIETWYTETIRQPLDRADLKKDDNQQIGHKSTM